MRSCTNTDPLVNRITWSDFNAAAQRIVERWRARRDVDAVWGVPRGGLVPAAYVASGLQLPLINELPAEGSHERSRTLVIDDLVDSGSTAKRYRDAQFDACFRKSHSPIYPAELAPVRDGWLVFPWEDAAEQHGPADAVVRLLEHIGEDPARSGLADTPARVLRSLTEMTAGYQDDPGAHLGVQFDVPTNGGLVLVDGIRFTSLCEHHMLPFVGTAAVGYQPGKRVVGLSKLARVVHTFARRLQVQERMTEQIADALQEHLEPEGAGVVVRGTHACMTARGVLQPDSTMRTQAFRGNLNANDRALLLASV